MLETYKPNKTLGHKLQLIKEFDNERLNSITWEDNIYTITKWICYNILNKHIQENKIYF